MSWDDPDFEVAIPESLKEPEPEPEPAPAAPAVLKPKHLAKARQAEAVKKAAAARATRVDDTPLDDPVAERKRLEALQVRADLEAAEDAFGMDGEEVEIKEDELTEALKLVPLSRPSHYEVLASKVAEKVLEKKRPLDMMEFLRKLLGNMFVSLTPDDLKDLSAMLNAERNKKIEAARPKKKGKGKAKKTAMVERDDDLTRAPMGGGAGMYDDYDDFM